MKALLFNMPGIIVLSLVTYTSTFGQTDPEVKRILLQSQATHGTAWQKEHCFIIRASGNGRNNDHQVNPNKFHEFTMESELTVFPQDSIFRDNLKMNFTPEKKKESTQFFVKEQEFILYNNQFYSSHPDDSKISFARFQKLEPQFLVTHLLAHADELSISKIASKNKEIRLTFNDWDASNWVLILSASDKRFLRLERTYHHHFYGDAVKFYEWSDYTKFKDGLFPAKVKIGDMGFTQYEYTQRIEIPDSIPQPPQIDLSSPTLAKLADEQMYISKDSVFFERIAAGLYTIQLPQTNNRLMVAEFSDYLVLLEGSYNSKNGDLMLEILNEKFSGKPIKYWSFSHCHYMGFTRSMVAAGASIITSDENARAIPDLCRSSHSLSPDKLQQHPTLPKFELLQDSMLILKDSSMELQVYNIGPNHTEDYMVFYFPKQKIMFVGDLCWVNESSVPTKIEGRTLRFYESVVNDLKLEIETIYISWPLQWNVEGYGKYKNTIPYSMLLDQYTNALKKQDI